MKLKRSISIALTMMLTVATITGCTSSKEGEQSSTKGDTNSRIENNELVVK